MKKWICAWLLAALMAPWLSGEGMAVSAVDAFIERAGIEADGALREAIEALIEERGLNARIIARMDESLIARYAEYLAAGLPISYGELLYGASTPLAEGADFGALRQLAVLHPEGAATQSLLADFERMRLYYDEAWPVPEDVCRAGCAIELTEEMADALRGVLQSADPSEWEQTGSGDAASGLNVLALNLDGKVSRYAVPGVGEAPEAFVDALQALLAEGAAVARDRERTATGIESEDVHE